jgi:hypothetical protein
MLKFNKSIYVLLFAATTILSCSQSEDLAVDSDAPSQENTGVVFRFLTNGPTMMTRSVEDSYDHVQGTVEEYQVNNARVYLYDAPTKLFIKSIALTNIKRIGSDVNGNIIYETDRVSVPQGSYDIFVLANSDKNISKPNEDQFLAAIDSTTYVKGQITDISNGVVMTNRASENANIAISNTPTSDENVISIKLERALARLDIAKSSDSYALTDAASKQYATVTLDRHYVVNLAKYYYLYRHTAVLNSMDEPTWNLGENFGNVNDVNGYVIDPYFFKKTIDASNFNNKDKYYEHFYGDYNNPDAITWTNFKPAAATPDYNTSYCLENCTLSPAQKNGYSTGVLFDAKFEPYNNVYHLNTATGALELVTDKTKYPEEIYYYNYNFYDSPEALANALGVTAVTAANMDVYQAKKFEKSDDGYHCYYIYWIRHLDNFMPTSMGVMEFAIVRNNLYRMLITKISGLGDGIPQVDTDKPDEGETYLKVVLNVKPWIVRDLNIVL